ncbi:MAG: S8 family serine peptidase [Myxococcota bacterium]
MRKTRIASAGLFALVAGLLLMSSSSDRAPAQKALAGSQATNDLATLDRTPSAVATPGPELDVPWDEATLEAPVALDVDADHYRPGERLVRLTDPMELPDLAARYALTVERPVGRSGYAVVRGTAEALGLLALDPAVERMAANGIVRGATSEEEAAELTGEAFSTGHRLGNGADEWMQWHIDKVDPIRSSSTPTNIVVAVLDTGVAYETATRYGVAYKVAPTLASNPIVAPYDFINNDPHANDDHQHGTHIASIIGSNGAIKGTAPGVALMPVKVLDETNRGSEWSLVEGIWWAVDNQADIINLSLSFGSGYRPSTALLEALQAAAEADILMVGATGNDGLDQVSWPAASPLVMAVAGAELTATERYWNGLKIASYANASAAVEIVAPGGNLDTDINLDGVRDGIVGESIHPDDPTKVGYWLMAGTSQATAQISGLAVELLRTGVSALEAESMLKYKAENGKLSAGYGSGFADMDWNVPLAHPPHTELHVAWLPYLQRVGSSSIRPVARATVFHASGSKAANVEVTASIWGNGDGIETCRTDANGQCFIQGSPVARYDAQGNEVAFAWSMAVQTVGAQFTEHGSYLAYRPKAAITHTQNFQDLVAAMQADSTLSQSALGWVWSDGSDAQLGSLAAGFSLTDSGSGLTSIPLGVVMTRPSIDDLGNTTQQTLDVGGQDVAVTVLNLDGNGLRSLPLGLTLDPIDDTITYAFLDGTGLLSIPLGVKPGDGFGDGIPSPLDDPDPVLSGTALGQKLADGGWTVAGYGGATLIGSSETLGIMPTMLKPLEMGGVSLEAIPLD